MRARAFLIAIGLSGGLAAGLMLPAPTAARQTEECNHHDCFWTSGTCRWLFGSNCTEAAPWGCEAEIC